MLNRIARPMSRKRGICFRSTQAYTKEGLTPRNPAAVFTSTGASNSSLPVEYSPADSLDCGKVAPFPAIFLPSSSLLADRRWGHYFESCLALLLQFRVE